MPRAKRGAEKVGEIRLAVELLGSLRRPGEEAQQEVVLPRGATVDDLLAKLQVAPHHRRFVQVVHDGDVLEADAVLKNGMPLKLFVPVGGG